MTLPMPLLLLLLLLASSLPFPLLAQDSPHLPDSHSPPPQCPDHSALYQELDQAKRTLLDLERSLSEKDAALQEKFNIISSLQDEFRKLKEKGASDLDAVEREWSSKVTRLQGDLTRTELELQKYTENAKVLVSVSDSYSSRIKELEKLVSDQKNKIINAENALRVAELTLGKIQEEVDTKERELLKVHAGWLPPWAEEKSLELQDSAVIYWKTYVQPFVYATKEKIGEQTSAVWKSSKPYVDNLKTCLRESWSPKIKQNMDFIVSVVTPHIQNAKTKIVEGYGSTVNTLSPQLEKILDAVKPHLEAARDISMPYVEKISSFLQPYYKQAEAMTKPYRRKVFEGYREFLTSAADYHSQLQVVVQTEIKKVDILAPLASNELVWFLASALLFLPVMIFSSIFFSLLGPKKKPIRKNHGIHPHRKAKRSKHADK